MLRRPSLAHLSLALLLTAGCVTKTEDPDLAFVDEPKRNENLRSYDEIWQRVASTYLSPLPQRATTREAEQMPRVNWMAARDRHVARVQQASVQGEVRSAMREALAELGNPHFSLLPESITAAEGQASLQTNTSGSGLSLRLIADQLVVTEVEPGSSAAQAGVKPGWTVRSIGTQRVDITISGMRAELPGGGLSDVRLVDHFEAALNPDVGKYVRVTFSDGENRPLLKLLVGRPSTTKTSASRARALDGGILYFDCNAFLEPRQVIESFERLLVDHPSARGLIIDLRGNAGGLAAVATDLLGHLVGEASGETKIGVLVRRDVAIPYVVTPRVPTVRMPVAVLVDGSTMSTAEVFARAVQDLQLGRVFGEPTPGVALPVVVVRLTNGERLQYAPAEYVSVRGGRLESVGVQPDAAIAPDRNAVLAGRDPVLDAARAWIASQP